MNYQPSAHYDRVTAAWTLLLGDELHYGLFDESTTDLGPATRALTGAMKDAAQLEPGCEVLDVGCGTGTPACDLALTCGANVTGITTSAEGVSAAQERARALGIENLVSFMRRDGMDNGFPNESFDRVWVLESSHLMRDRDRLVSECARVLRPGGRVALCDITRQRELSLADVRRLRRPLMVLRDVFGDARMEPLAEYGRLAVASGLSVEQELDLTAATRPTFAFWRENAERHHDTVVRLLGEAELEQFVEACGILTGFWDDGTLGYGLISASKP